MIQALLLATALAQAPAEQAAAPPQPQWDSRALAPFERTKTTRATYSLYNWNWIQDPDGNLRQEWGAEFHSGSRHRVETPTIRVVADCDVQTGTLVNRARGVRLTGREVAQLACGINTARPILEAVWLGLTPSRFGPVDRLRIVDEVDERFYAIDRDGILVGAEVYGLAEGWCLQSEPIAVERSLPRGDIFSERSLNRSVVPGRFKRAPPRRVGDLWTSGRSCPPATGSPNE